MSKNIAVTLIALMGMTLATQLTTACGPSGKKRESIRASSGDGSKGKRDGDRPSTCTNGKDAQGKPCQNPSGTPRPNAEGGGSGGGSGSAEGSKAVYLDDQELQSVKNATAVAVNIDVAQFADQTPLQQIMGNTLTEDLMTVGQFESGSYELQSAHILITSDLSDSDTAQLLKFYFDLTNFTTYELNGPIASKAAVKLPLEIALKAPLYKKLVINDDDDTLVATESSQISALIEQANSEGPVTIKSSINTTTNGTDELALESDQGFEYNKGYVIEDVGRVTLRSSDSSNQQDVDHQVHLSVETEFTDSNDKTTLLTVLLIYKRTVETPSADDNGADDNVVAGDEVITGPEGTPIDL